MIVQYYNTKFYGDLKLEMQPPEFYKGKVDKEMYLAYESLWEDSLTNPFPIDSVALSSWSIINAAASLGVLQ